MTGNIWMSPVRSENGAAAIGILMVGGALLIGFSVVLSQIENGRRDFQYARSVEDAEFLKNSLTMMLSSRSVCLQNLTSTAFGADLNELQTRSDLGQTALQLPGGMDFQSIYRKFRLNGVKFSPLVRIIASDTAYLANLAIDFHAADQTAVRRMVIPFYLETDAAGRLINCFAAAQPSDPSAVTVENTLCAEREGAGYAYRFGQRFCSDKTVFNTATGGLPPGVVR